MHRCAELYKKLRNTFRFLLGNLSNSVPLLGHLTSFDPARDRVPEADLLPLDRYMLARTRELAEKILGWYETFEFHRIYHAVNEFAISDLSAFYLDVLKDRMYTFAPTNPARRSAQTVLWQITEALVKLTAPILTFTADEIWEHLPQVEGREASVHLARFPKPEEIFSENPTKLLEEWKPLFWLRDVVLRNLEKGRQDKKIGKGLEADLVIHAREKMLSLLQRYAPGLKEFFNVSGVRVVEDHELKVEKKVVNPDSPSGIVKTEEQVFELQVSVVPASGHKCARCWNFMPRVSNYGIWENVCDRCQAALREMGIEPPQAEGTA
jgi:isoleucyl-tRNA synthetase